MEILDQTTPSEKWASRLEKAFRRVRRERMADVPVINDKLKVEAAGFRPWNGHTLGVLVTPWFMNLMMLPGERDDWSDLLTGTKRSFAFESGSFEFIVGEEPGVGKFMGCSMFSPMFEFENHEAAMATAGAVIEGLFDGENQETFQPQSLGEENVETTEEVGLSEELLEGVQVIGEAARKNMDQPISRRDLLRGSFLRAQNRNDDKGRGEEC